jgi:hypothetical protein
VDTLQKSLSQLFDWIMSAYGMIKSVENLDITYGFSSLTDT